MATPREKLNALKARTLANGCTPGEVEAAELAINKLMEKHPDLAQPETKTYTFQFNEFNHKTAGATDWVKEGMRRAEEAAKRTKGNHWDDASWGAGGGFERFNESSRTFTNYAAATNFWMLFMVNYPELNATAKLRVIARSYQYNKFERATFIEIMVGFGFNRGTASTQWSRAKTQV